MAAVATPWNAQLQRKRLNTFPKPYQAQHDPVIDQERLSMPFLYPLPRLQIPPRDSGKAKRMLGLVTEFPQQREERRAHVRGGNGGSLEERLLRAEMEVRRFSGLDVSDESCQGEEEVTREERASPVSELEEHVESAKLEPPTPTWITARPRLQGEQDTLNYSRPRSEVRLEDLPPLPPVPLLHIHPAHRPVSPALELAPAPAPAQEREDLQPPPSLLKPARPPSFSSSHPTNKIASSRSRGLRANSYPNFSRPLSSVIPRPVAGEDIEQDPLYMQYHDDEVGPPSPSSPNAGPVVFTDEEWFVSEEDRVEQMAKSKGKGHRPRMMKYRWGSLPLSLIKLGKRRESAAKEELAQKGKEVGKTEVREGRFKLTEENLLRWEVEAGHTPKMYGLEIDAVGNPEQMDEEDRQGTDVDSHTRQNAQPQGLNLKLMLLPELNRMEELTLSPLSLSPQTPATSSIPPPHQTHSREPTLLYLCRICHERKPPSNFPARRITPSCTHDSHACLSCVQNWIDTCIQSWGWDRCTCPECRQPLSYSDVQALASEQTFKR